MENVGPGITKRLSFGDMTENLLAAQQLDVAGIIKALKVPSVENFQAYVSLSYLSQYVVRKRNRWKRTS